MIDEIVRETTILWESRDPRNVPEIARERISKYFSETDGNVPTIFVRYQVSAEGLRFLLHQFLDLLALVFVLLILICFLELED